MSVGGCQCGAVRYRLSGPPSGLFVCHCTDCRRQSASAFGISVFVPARALSLERGEPRCWSRPGTLAGTVDCFFCGDCGVRLWHASRDAPETVSIKGGTLDEPVDLSAAIHVWTRSRLPGVPIPEDAEQHAEEPDE